MSRDSTAASHTPDRNQFRHRAPTTCAAYANTALVLEIRRKRLWIQGFPGRKPRQFIPAHRSGRAEDALPHELSDLRPAVVQHRPRVGAPEDVASDRVV